MFVFQFLRYSR